MAGKRQGLTFDKRGGIIVLCRKLIESENYQTLSVHARALMTLLQVQWRSDKPVDYGVREAEKRLVCNRKTAMKAFDLLVERGFILCIEQSVFSSRTQSKSRSWRLEWLPFDFNPPSNDWEKWTAKK